MPSEHEEEIRTAVVDRLREGFPDGRIIHELNVAGQGSNRIDVVTVTPDRIVAVEIKSKLDKLTRLPEQLSAFRNVADHVIVAAHRKHFVEYGTKWSAGLRLNTDAIKNPLSYRDDGHCWCFPASERPSTELDRKAPMVWSLRDALKARTVPNARCLPDILWRNELHEVCTSHRIPVTKRATCAQMGDLVGRLLTGEELKKAVCAKLRARPFARADEPIGDHPGGSW